MTKDNKFVCFHDPNLGRMCGQPDKKINNMTFDEVRALRLTGDPLYEKYKNAPAALRVPTLDEYLAICKKYNKVAEIEIKEGYTDAQLKALYDHCAKVLGNRKYILFSMDFSSKTDQGLKYVIKMAQFVAADQKTNIELLHLNGHGSDKVDVLKKYKINEGIRFDRLTAKKEKKFHGAGLKLTCYTVDDRDEAVNLVRNYGVEYITTDVILW